MKTKLLGCIATWLANRFFPRPATRAEAAQGRQYAALMVLYLRLCEKYGERPLSSPFYDLLVGDKSNG